VNYSGFIRNILLIQCAAKGKKSYSKIGESHSAVRQRGKRSHRIIGGRSLLDHSGGIGGNSYRHSSSTVACCSVGSSIGGMEEEQAVKPTLYYSRSSSIVWERRKERWRARRRKLLWPCLTVDVFSFLLQIVTRLTCSGNGISNERLVIGGLVHTRVDLLGRKPLLWQNQFLSRHLELTDVTWFETMDSAKERKWVTSVCQKMP
jgi:hypothetical protein